MFSIRQTPAANFPYYASRLSRPHFLPFLLQLAPPPVLTVAAVPLVPPMDVSFIAIIDSGKDARWLWLSNSVTELLGWLPEELVGKSPFELMHPDELHKVQEMHYQTVSQDKAAAVAFLQFKHKDPGRYILCKIARSVIHDALIGSVSAAHEGNRLMVSTSTAQEVEVISSDAARFCYRRWNDPTPAPVNFPSRSSPAVSSPSPSSNGDSSEALVETMRRYDDQFPYDTVHPSERTGLILNRFTLGCTVLYCTNDLILDSKLVQNRFFFDFVDEEDQADVLRWVNMVKGWAKSDKTDGPPADGGFYFGKFKLCRAGRHSIINSATQPGSDHPPRKVTHRQRPSAVAAGSGGAGSRRRSRSNATNATSRTGHESSQASRLPATAEEQNRNGEEAAGPPSTVSESSSKTQEPRYSEDTVEAIFSAHSDGLIVILRRAQELASRSRT
ncbi:hypothetical protein SISNIDRAFT_454775 [Sistotremastrum niveocremeum HHB9708]|uniref:PAS domain-containing protein n=1 Tax=Sistotremastrum niveocremeum HHB9708 TaxID=1314777 RepID=A0A164UVA3_9AGAM|nr:hypothetical protein SISNIDRAFT_454775 [Sistotremastrum niveocremeum HHB9708]